MITENEMKVFAEEFAKVLEDGMKVADEVANVFERTYGVLLQEVKLKCAEKLIYYADKYSHATFITRWYWMRKMKKFVKGIDVLKEL